MLVRTKGRFTAMHRSGAALFLLTFAMLLVCTPALGQQNYVSRFDVFAGYSFLDSPHVGLFENGFHMQAGVRPKTWYSLGFDYSISSGNMTLTPGLLTPAYQQQLGALMQQLIAAGLVPPGYVLTVPTHSRTQTFAGGPQLAYRHFSKMTLFIRPSIGAIYEVGTPKPADPIQKIVVQGLAPNGNKTDWTLFYGFGGGADFLFSKHVALRVQSDLVYDHLFNDLLKDGRWTVRFSIGPCFNFGKNIKKK